MPQHEPREMTELCDREVGRKSRLPALTPFHPDAHVGRMQHAHIVASIANGGGAATGVLPYQPDNLRLLRWSASAEDDGRRCARDLHEKALVVSHTQLQRLAVEDEAGRVDRALRVAVELLPRFGWRVHGDGVEGLVTCHQRGVLRVRTGMETRSTPSDHAGVLHRL